jgi:hypothetical protein
MKQHFLVELPDSCKVTILFHAQNVAVPSRLPDVESLHCYEVRFPKDASIRIAHSAEHFAVKIVPEGEELDDCDHGGSSEHPSPSPSPSPSPCP